MRIIKLLAVFAVSGAMLTGCASTGLVHDKDYLRAVSISGDDEKNITLSFFSDKKDTIESSGRDISSAVRNAELKTGKPIVTGYTELVIIDGCDNTDTLTYLLTEWKVSPSCIVAYSDNGRETLDKGSAEKLEGSVREASKQGRSPESDIVTVLSKLLEKEKTAEIAEISADGFIGTVNIS